MATTQVKDGFSGGSDNQLKVNADGSINTNSTSTGTSNVNVVSSVLPTGAATAAKQDTGNTSLASIDGKLNSLGQKTMANSVPVVIASDQTVPVSVSNFPATVAVTQSTSPWVVSGTVTSNIGTTNGLALDATVSGLLTNAQLRATPVPISGTVTSNLAQTSFTTGSKSAIGTSAVQIIATSTPAKIGVVVKAANSNTGTVYIGNSTGVTAGTTDATDGFELAGGESVTIDIDNVNKLYAIGSASGQKVYWTAD